METTLQQEYYCCHPNNLYLTIKESYQLNNQSYISKCIKKQFHLYVCRIVIYCSIFQDLCLILFKFLWGSHKERILQQMLSTVINLQEWKNLHLKYECSKIPACTVILDPVSSQNNWLSYCLLQVNQKKFLQVF